MSEDASPHTYPRKSSVLWRIIVMYVLIAVLVYICAGISYVAGMTKFTPGWIPFLETTITVMALFISLGGVLYIEIGKAILNEQRDEGEYFRKVKEREGVPEKEIVKSLQELGQKYISGLFALNMMWTPLFITGALGISLALVLILYNNASDAAIILWFSNFFLACESMNFFLLSNGITQVIRGRLQSPYR